MNKTAIMWLLAGWALAVLLPPTRVLGFLKGQA